MDIAEWWPLLKPDTRRWLVEHNGEPLTPDVASEIRTLIGTWIATAGRETAARAWVVEHPDGPALTDEAVDWIEAVANDEQ